ncbi:hypothetical protein Scep_021829 [Stephania cephalantha]|uniref:Uncharacterized protein n=1 Tax=Stephania cephalantha TaxID=152367 RepID=A0AAP0I1S1_9MAGN
MRLHPRPECDTDYLHSILESIARIETPIIYCRNISSSAKGCLELCRGLHQVLMSISAGKLPRSN